MRWIIFYMVIAVGYGQQCRFYDITWIPSDSVLTAHLGIATPLARRPWPSDVFWSCKRYLRLWSQYHPFPSLILSDSSWVVTGLIDTTLVVLWFQGDSLIRTQQISAVGGEGVIAAGWSLLSYSDSTFLVPMLLSDGSLAVIEISEQGNIYHQWRFSHSDWYPWSHPVYDLQIQLVKTQKGFKVIHYRRYPSMENASECKAIGYFIELQDTTFSIQKGNYVEGFTTVEGDGLMAIEPIDSMGYLAVYGGTWGPGWLLLDSSWNVQQAFRFHYSYKEYEGISYLCNICLQGRFQGVLKTNDGYLFYGYVPYYHDNSDILLMKLDNNFSVQWSRVIGTPWHDMVFDVITSGDGGYIVMGLRLYREGFYFPKDTMEDRGLVVKVNSSGVVEWIRELPQIRMVTSGVVKDSTLLLVGVNQDERLVIVSLNLQGGGCCVGSITEYFVVRPRIKFISQNVVFQLLSTGNLSVLSGGVLAQLVNLTAKGISCP